MTDIFDVEVGFECVDCRAWVVRLGVVDVPDPPVCERIMSSLSSSTLGTLHANPA